MLRAIIRVLVAMLGVLSVIIIYWALHILGGIRYGYLLALACSTFFLSAAIFVFRSGRGIACWLLLVGSVALFIFDVHETTIISMLDFGWLDRLSDHTRSFIFPGCTENPQIAAPFAYV